MAKTRKSKLKLFYLAIIIIAPIVVGVGAQHYSSSTGTKPTVEDENSLCRNLENDPNYPVCHSAFEWVGWPLRHEADLTIDIDVGYQRRRTIVLNVVIISVSTYALVGVSTLIRRKFFNQAADGSPLEVRSPQKVNLLPNPPRSNLQLLGFAVIFLLPILVSWGIQERARYLEPDTAVDRKITLDQHIPINSRPYIVCRNGGLGPDDAYLDCSVEVDQVGWPVKVDRNSKSLAAYELLNIAIISSSTYVLVAAGIVSGRNFFNQNANGPQ